MQDEEPSGTAWRVALGRAAHQLFDHPRVFDDPLALRILGADHQNLFEQSEKTSRLGQALRAFMAVRSRLAEDELCAAVKRGVGQYVILGAGLDTFAYRNPYSDQLQVFEVDHPATQKWKRTLLERAAIAVPRSLTFVPVDFERQTAFAALSRCGFDADRPAFFAWLGVTMYLSEEVVLAVLKAVASLPAGGRMVFDYSVHPSELGFLQRQVLAEFARRVEQAGEPWVTSFVPATLAASLLEAGFKDVHDFSPDEINRLYFSGRSDGLWVGSLARIVRAST